MKEFGLALGWWAARWLAHIGVIRYLENIWKLPKEVSWTSMWSMIAWAYAIGKNSHEMEEITKSINYFKLIDLDFKKWLLTWNKIKKFLESLYWDSRIEDLKIKLRIVAVDIKTWEKIVFDKWKIVDAVRSSVSIPWIISPNKIWHHEYVDWWIVNNLPIEEIESSNVVAVSVVRDISRAIHTDTKILWFNFKHNFFWLNYQILQKTIDIMMNQNELRSIWCNKNIILLQPKINWIDYYQFNKYEKIIKAWIVEAKEKDLIWKMIEKFK